MTTDSVTILPYNHTSLKDTARVTCDNINANAITTCFEGWDMHLSMVNTTNECIYVFTESGRFLKEIPPQRTMSAAMVSEYGLIIGYETMTDVSQSNRKATERQWLRHTIYTNQLANRPLLLTDLGLIITTATTRDQVINSQSQLKNLLYGREIMSVDGKPVFPDAMIVYGNFLNGATPHFYLAINNTVVRVSSVHTPLLPPGKATLFIDEALPNNNLMRRVIEYTAPDGKEENTGVCDSLSTVECGNGIIQTANYALSQDYDLVKQYLARKRAENEANGMCILPDGKAVITPEETQQIIAQKVRLLTQTSVEQAEAADKAAAAAKDELATSKRQLAELEKERKLLLSYVERGMNPETIDQRVAAKEAELEHQARDRELGHSKARLEMTQKTVSIAAGTFSLLALFAAPIKTFFSWLGSKLGFLAVAAV